MKSCQQVRMNNPYEEYYNKLNQPETKKEKILNLKENETEFFFSYPTPNEKTYVITNISKTNTSSKK